MSGVTRSNRLTCALSLLKTLEADASTKVTASLDALSDDFAEVVLGFSCADVIARPGMFTLICRLPQHKADCVQLVSL